MEEQTNILGIPVPSSNPVFLTFVVVHILIALVCVASGLLAMLTQKTNPKHPNFGKIYYWSMLFAFVSVIILSVMRWPHNIHLLSIGTLAIVFTCAGRWIAQRNYIRHSGRQSFATLGKHKQRPFAFRSIERNF